MKIVLATGIYPPDIGGPATYVRHLAEELQKAGEEVTVITYGNEPFDAAQGRQLIMNNEQWPVVRVSLAGGPLKRWHRYAIALKKHASDADIVYAFSSVSVGMPLLFARLHKPKCVLRLGGDFAWERATDNGDTRTLREWYAARTRTHKLLGRLLRSFAYIVFSSSFQESLCEAAHWKLPLHSVIENAVPRSMNNAGVRPALGHAKHNPLRLLFLGRFVGFKNLPSLVRALSVMPDMRLTLCGDGPEKEHILSLAESLGVSDRMEMRPPVSGDAKQTLFDDHDLFVLPSLTEISPNAALEARAAGLPVLLTAETGLSPALSAVMVIAPLRTPAEIAAAIGDIARRYDVIASAAAAPALTRSWKDVCDEHLRLFSSLS